jgi:hypothetical protein
MGQRLRLPIAVIDCPEAADHIADEQLIFGNDREAYAKRTEFAAR